MSKRLCLGPRFSVDSPGTLTDGSSMIGMFRHWTSGSVRTFTQKGASRKTESRLVAVASSTGLASTLRPAPARTQ